MTERDVVRFLEERGFKIYDKEFSPLSQERGLPPYAVIVDGESHLRSCAYRPLEGQDGVKAVTIKDGKEEKVIGLCCKGDFYKV